MEGEIIPESKEIITEKSPIQKYEKRMVSSLLIQMNFFEEKPHVQKYFRDAIKIYHPIKKNRYLDRKKRIIQEDDIYICNCLPINEAENIKFKFILW